MAGGQDDGVTAVTLRRRLRTDDDLDVEIKPGKTLSLSWTVHSSSTFDSCGEEHGTITVSFEVLEDDDEYGTEFLIHGIRASTVWGLLVPAAVLTARFFKWHWMWYWVHLFLGGSAFVITFYGVSDASGDNACPYARLQDDKLTHSRLGFMLASFVAGHCVFGLALRVIMKKTHKPYKLAVMRNVHFSVGWTLTIVGLIEVYVGWDIYDDKYTSVVAAYYAILALVFCFLELWTRFWFIYPRLSCRGELREMTHSEVMREVFLKQKQLVFYDELVLDVSKFSDSHPGGKLIIEDAIGEDFGKYINGCSSYGDGITPYYHSDQTRLIIEKLAVGVLKYPEVFITDNEVSNRYLETPWTLVAKTKLAGTLTKLLSYESSRHSFSKPKGVTWLGRHFRMAFFQKGKWVYRYYSAVVCMAPEIYSQWSDYLKATKMAFTKTELNYSLESEADDHMNTARELLHLIVKEYKPHGLVSQFAAGMALGESVYLKGPLGPGLCIDENSKGLHIAFGGGTGLVPFLDLVYLLWKLESGQEVVGLSQDFKLVLYVSFGSYQDCFAIDVLRKTRDLCVANNSDRFHLHLYISEAEETIKLSVPLLQSFIGDSQLNLAWACGPSSFNRWVCEMLLSQGISRTRVILL